jgi:biopolymer transport protein ExbB
VGSLFQSFGQETLLYRFVLSGGVTMFLLIPCSIIAVALIIHGLIDLRRGKIMPKGVEDVFRAVGSLPSLEDMQKNLKACPESPLTRVCLRLLPWIGKHGESWDLTVQQVSSEEVAGLYQRHGYLSLIYQVAPLLGLLGTILGMIRAFHTFGISETRTVGDLGKGISEALVTTMWGLMIAVPSQFFLSFFRQRLYRYEGDLIPAAVRELFAMLPRPARPSPARPVVSAVAAAPKPAVPAAPKPATSTQEY